MEEKDSKQNQSPTTQPTEPSAPDHPIEKKKGLSMGIKVLIAALVLIILGGAAYFLNLKQSPLLKTPDKQAITTVTPKPNTISIENWKTYTNT
ncbi:MAG: hypothetical protein M1365_07805, partial [Actinobacteria bacterium]|nr:hypothetical protein [Actinomycetota bacterium]